MPGHVRVIDKRNGVMAISRLLAGSDLRGLVTTHRGALPSGEGFLAALLLSCAIVFNLYHLSPEVTSGAPLLNDGVLHLLALRRTVVALAAMQDPTDPWLATIGMGYPLFHYYQHLPYLPPAILSLLLGDRLPSASIFHWTNYLLLSLFPLSIYWSMRCFGFCRLQGALGGLVASLVATNGLYGLDFASYVWRGHGLYTQLWGMLLLPPALAQGYACLREGRGYWRAVLLLAVTLLSHLVCGYIASLTLLVLALLPAAVGRSQGNARDVLWRRGRRLVLLLSLVGLVTAYFWIPFSLDRPYLNRSVWERQAKYDSYGYEWVLGALVRGELFDYGRFPALTICVGIGLALCLRRWREERYRVPVVLLLVWLVLYFGRPTWGVLLHLLPMSRELHFHRLIAGIHLGGIYLMGLGLALPWRWASSRRNAWSLLAAAALTALLLAPVYRERAAYLAENARLMAASRQTHAAEERDLAALVKTLRQAPPGRVYAGLAGTWGRQYRVGAVPVYALLQDAGLDSLGFLYHSLSLNADIQVLFDERRPEHYNTFNVRYVVAPADRSFPQFVTPIGDFGRHRLYEVATTGYFDLVGSDLTLVGDRDDWYPAASRWLGSDQPRVGRHPTLRFDDATIDYREFFPLSRAEALIPQAALPPAAARGRVVAEWIESNAYLARIQVERDSVLMLKATYHPNWHASVDGVEVGAAMLMPSYVGVAVGPGTHDVRLEYRSGFLRGALLLLGLCALPLIALAERRVDRLGRLVGWPAPWRILAPGGRAARRVASWRLYLSARRRLAPHLPYLGGLTLLALLAGLPLFQFKVMSGHDALEYLPRNVEFYEGLRAGQLLPRWAPDLNAGYGEPFFNFNPPGIYYLSAFFHGLGFSFVAAANLACFALLLLAGLGMYLLAGEFFGPRGGLVSAAAYLFAPYLLVALYVRHALADFSAFAPIPLALWGLYRFVAGGRCPALALGAVSLALLLLSSNPVALITVPALALLVVWLAWAGRSWRALLRGGWCLALGLGLSAFFWLPALVERDFVQVFRLLEGYLSYRNHFVYPGQLIRAPWGYGLSLPGPADGMSFAIGPVHLVLVGASVVLIRRLRATPGRGGLLVTYSLVLLLLAAFFSSTASQFLWDRLALLQYLQFPWRFLSLVAASTAFLSGCPFLLLPPDARRLANGLMGGIIVALVLFGLPRARPETFLEIADGDYSPRVIAAENIAVTTAGEYAPIWVQERPRTPAAAALTILSGRGRVQVIGRSPARAEFRATVMEAAWLRVNTFYFPGWTLYVDGARRAIDFRNPQGVMEFALKPGEHLVQVVFADTPIRLWSARLSLLALALLCLTPLAAKWYTTRGNLRRWRLARRLRPR